MTDDRLSPRAHALGVLTVAVFTVLAATPLRAQRHVTVASMRTTLDGAKEPNAFATGDSVEVEYARRGEWIPARVTDVVNEGYAYTVDLAPYDDGKTISAQIHYSRVRARVAAAVAARSVTPSSVASLPVVVATPASTVPPAVAVAVPPTLECAALAGCEPTPYIALQQGSNEAAATAAAGVPAPVPTAPPAPATAATASTSVPSASPRGDAFLPGPSAIPPGPIPLASSPLALVRRIEP